jgi:hypothetical protein
MLAIKKSALYSNIFDSDIIKNKERVDFMDKNAYFEIGIGKVEITPPLSIPYLGYSPRHAFFTGVHDSLYARSIVVSNGEGEVAIIATDTFGFSNSILEENRNFTQEVRNRVKEKTGIPSNSIMLAGSHIHSTPDTLDIRPLKDTPAAIPWLEVLIDQLVSSVTIASRNRFKAHLKVGQGKVGGISCNRRRESCLDREIIVLLFESLDKKESVIMVNFACHPVIVQVQELISADYVGVLETTIENTLKEVKGCLFLQGACADINPRRGDTRDFRDVYLTGTALAGEVMKNYGYMAMPDYPEQSVKVRAISQNVLLSSRSLPTKEEVGRSWEKAKRIVNETKNERERIKARERLRQEEESLCRLKEGSGPFLAEIQLIQLGNALLVGIPGEPFCRMGMEIKKESRPMIGIPVGYVNGYLGYLASAEAWGKGGYEVSCGPWSKVGPGGFTRIMETFAQIRTSFR